MNISNTPTLPYDWSLEGHWYWYYDDKIWFFKHSKKSA